LGGRGRKVLEIHVYSRDYKVKLVAYKFEKLLHGGSNYRFLMLDREKVP
jgi:hypothetical protein